MKTQMTKTLKHIAICLVGALAFLLAGVFFAGCGKDYSKVQLVADQSSIELEVGESVSVVFKIENYKKGFSNEVQVNTRMNGQADVFEASNQTYLSGHRVRVTITGKAGGSGQINAMTVQGGKECSVDVSVKQFTNSLSSTGQVFYVSDSTDFTPDDGILTFDPNTTETDVSFFYVDNDMNPKLDLKQYNKVVAFDVESLTATFSDGTGTPTLNVLPFDSVELNDGHLFLNVDGELTEIENAGTFNFLALYDHSLSEDAEQLLCVIEQAYVLPNLDVSISGQYLTLDEFGQPKLENAQFDEEGNLVDDGFVEGVTSAKIVPNNKNKAEYILKVSSNTLGSNVDKLLGISEGFEENVVVDYVTAQEIGLDESAEQDNVFFIKITQNSQVQCSTQLTLKVFYDIAKNVGDDSVNKVINFAIETQIAPQAILVNGTDEEQTITLYRNNYGGFGWVNLNVDVISNFNTSPNFDGVSFAFDSAYLRMEYNGTAVSTTRMYDDLSIPFRVQGLARTESTTITVSLESDILEEGTTLQTTINCVVIDGATTLDCDLNQEVYTLDVAGGAKTFNYVFANDAYQYATVRRMTGNNIADFDVGAPFVQNGKFYVALTINPVAVGTARYRIILDNGTFTELTFSCINVLTEESTSIRLTRSGNDAVMNSSVSANESGFNNTLNLEILNPTESGGARASVEVLSAYPDGMRAPVPDNNYYLSLEQRGNVLNISTRGNGFTVIEWHLNGLQIKKNDDGSSTFETIDVEFVLYVRVSTYTLVDNLYLVNADGFSAYNNTVYVGGENADNSVTFSSRVSRESATNFFQYQFSNDFAKEVFENSVSTVNNNFSYQISTAEENTFIKQVLNSQQSNASYDDKYLYFYAEQERVQNGTTLRMAIPTATTVTVLKNNGQERKNVQLRFDNALMFYVEQPLTYTDPTTGNTYEVRFDNVFQLIGGYGQFNLNNFTYTATSLWTGTVVLNTRLSQRNSTKQFDATITVANYVSVEYIGLQSSLTRLDFSNQELTKPLVVSVNPTYATNPDVTWQFDTTNGNPYTNMIDVSISSNGNGGFSVVVSCEEFFEQMSGRLSEITTSLTGILYIFPTDWGDTASSIGGGRQPIALEVQFRNGSKANPFLLSTAEDVIGINASLDSLASHYEVSGIIDMSRVGTVTPIGVMNGQLVGFSGSIVGTTSQSEIRGVNISNSSFSTLVDDRLFAGLFAKINDTAEIENLTISGRIRLSCGSAFVGLLAGMNYGTLTNVGAILDEFDSTASTISISGNGSLYFGGLVGVNNGNILQDFTKYDGTAYCFMKVATSAVLDGELVVDGVQHRVLGRQVDQILQDEKLGRYVVVQDQQLRLNEEGMCVDANGDFLKFDSNGDLVPSSHDFTGQNSKNLAYFHKTVTVSSENGQVFAGGIAGASNGVVERILPVVASYKMYNYTPYSAYATITVTGNATTYVGGAVGVTAYTTNLVPDFDGTANMDGDVASFENVVRNLLIGGEINALSVDLNSLCYVGGIVGFASATGTGASNVYVEILSNTSRVFLRGNTYVGGIAGFANLVDGLTTQLVRFADENKIEAVDDGRSSFYSASIIRRSILNEVNGFDISSMDDAEKGRFFALGNYLERANVKNYFDTYETTGFSFVANSYLLRDIIEGGVGTHVTSPNTGSTSYTYGDYIVVGQESTFVISNIWNFERKVVDLGQTESHFSMTATDGNKDVSVFFMYYFDVTTDLDGLLGLGARDAIQALNTFSPNQTDLYPLVFSNNEISVSATENSNIAVDINGNLTVSQSGLTTIRISSILNTSVQKVIYLYVVNFFDSRIDASIFYTTATLDGNLIVDGASLPVYGNSYSFMYVVPTYSIESVASDGNAFSISQEGVLNFQSVNYRMARNSQVKIDVQQPTQFVQHDADSVQHNVDDDTYYVTDESGNNIPVDEEGFEIDENGNRKLVLTEEYFSVFQANRQSLVFSKDRNKNTDDKSDTYILTPVLTVEVEGHLFCFALTNSKITLQVTYRERAEAISVHKSAESIRTNGHFENTVTIKSTNENELLFYEILDEEGRQVQQRLPEQVGTYLIGNHLFDTYEEYINCSMTDELFVLEFERNKDNNNEFKFTFRVNTNSPAYAERYINSIFETYTIRFFASELREGVYCTMKVGLDDAVLTNVDVNNYSNINNIARTDSVIVPAQRGVLEISLDPFDCIFDRIYISNNAINNNPGAGRAMFTFVYQVSSQYESTQFVERPTFGSVNNNGEFTFTYLELLDLYRTLGSSFSYTGKMYVSYYLPPSNVDDGAQIAFDVRVTQGENVHVVTIPLVTKLTNYARFVFNDKQKIGDAYYVARGLSYGLTLQSYGYNESQITWETSDDRVSILPLGDGQFTLMVENSEYIYNAGQPGFAVTVTVNANKIVDNRPVPYSEDMQLYVMEYVFNYAYQTGVNEDVVSGMRDGVVTTAVGNPVALSLSLQQFMEYDSTNSAIAEKVNTFINGMTSVAVWTAVENGESTTLARGKDFASADGYYRVSSFVVTPLRIYSPDSNIYHFTVEAHFAMQAGEYMFTANAQGFNQLFSAFSFDVHNQSTQDSPIPVRNLSEFLGMQDNEWYILLDNIILPSAEFAQQNGLEQFSPIQAQIAGLDGNSHTIYFGGTYAYDNSVSNVGVFQRVTEGAILQNVHIQLYSSTNIVMDAETFNLGMLTADNAGIITNCSVASAGYGLTVSHTATVTSSFVAGLVANNEGNITHSRSNLSIYTNVDVSGFVANNSGHIASSAFRDASVVNNTNGAETTAGFVLTNSGEIFTSYVSGARSGDGYTQYYKYQDSDSESEDIISSSGNVTGFAYVNEGEIYDCYSNINISQSGGQSAGFVFNNSGRVERCFSTSVLEGERTSNFGFVNINLVEDEDGGIFDCFYLADEGDKVNLGLGDREGNTPADVKVLDLEGFANKDNFKNFVVGDGRDMNSVWFFNTDANNIDNFDSVQFNTNRIELVAANIIASSSRTLFSVDEVTDSSGVTYYQYTYVYSVDSPLGSMTNPILISSAETFERYITQENNSGGYNFAWYRLICDVDYEEYIQNNQTFNTKFMGYLEGNFHEVRGQKLISTNTMTYAGLFAEVGNPGLTGSIGTVMNLTLAPQTIDFANAQVVGGVAGRLNGGKLLNVNLVSDEENSVIGFNIVGGLVGLSVANFKIQNVHSDFGAKARNSNIKDNNFNSNISDFKDLSFAGSVAGVLSGEGTFYGCTTNTVVSSLADKAGLVFGFVDEGVNVTKVALMLDNQMLVHGYSYAGLIVGHSKGIFQDVTITSVSEQVFENFYQDPYVPMAIGGFAGLVSGGVIEDISVSVRLNESSDSSESLVQSIGSVVGIIDGAATLKNVSVNSTIVGYTFVGGVVGSITSSQTVNFENIDVTASLSALGAKQSEIGVGGLVGKTSEVSSIRITSDATNDELSISEIAEDQRLLAEKRSALETEQQKESGQDQGLITSLQNEIAGLERDLAALQNKMNEESNHMDIVINVHTFSYASNSAIIRIGTLVGSNASVASHIVSDCITSLNANVLLRRLALQETSTATVNFDGPEYDTSFFQLNNIESTRCVLTGSASFECTILDGRPINRVDVNCFA